MSCKCYYCVKHKEINMAKRNRAVDTLEKLAIELGGRALSAEFDADYYNLILNGEWGDSGVDILERALKKAKEKQTARWADEGKLEK